MQEKRVRSKSEEKRLQITDAAGMLFIEHGFEKVSMEEIAKSAGVSKQTVYSHFGNKQQLFTAAIDNKCDEYDLVPNQANANMGCREYLEYFCIHLTALLNSSDAIGILRVCIRESANSEVGELFWQAGPGRIRQQLYNYLSEQTKLGNLRISNIDVACSQLCALLSETQTRNLLCLNDDKSTKQLEDYARSCASMFLQAYRP